MKRLNSLLTERFGSGHKNIAVGTALVALAFVLVCLGLFLKEQNPTRRPAPYTVYKQGNLELLPTAARERNNLVIGIESLSGFLHPVITRSDGNTAAARLVFESLIAMDETGRPTLQLAKDMQISDDGKVYTFYLKDSVFSDGHALTTDDVKASLTAFCDVSVDLCDNVPNPYAQWLSNLAGYDDFRSGVSGSVEGIRTEPGSISFYFEDGRFSNIWAFLTPVFDAGRFGDFQPGTVYESLRSSAAQPVGTGSYQVSLADPDKIQLVVNEHLTRDMPPVEEIIIMAASPSAAAPLFEAGRLDLYDFGANRSQLSNLMQTEAAGIYIYESPSMGILGFNCRNALLQDASLRQAIAYAIDRTALVEKAYGQNGQVPLAVLPNASWLVPDGLEPYDYDPEKAVSILEKIGYLTGEDGVRQKNGDRLEFRLLTYNAGIAPQIVEEIIKNLSQVGIQVHLEQRAYNRMQEQIFAQDFDLYYAGSTYSYEPEFIDKFSAYGRSNAEGWRSDEAEALLEKANQEAEPDVRQHTLRQWLKLFNRELPQLPIDMPNRFVMVSPRIEGVVPSVFGNWNNIENYTIVQ